jgi:hypothetical protein
MLKSLTILWRTLTALATIAVVGLSPSLVQAQNVRTLDLGEPRSSEQFFQQGRKQFEQELQKLQTPRPETPLLTISPTLDPQRKLDAHPPEPGEPPVLAAPPIAH